MFTGLCGVSLLLWGRPLLDTFALAASDGQYTQILLILPVTIALIYQGWRERGFETRLWTPAAGLLVISLLMAGLARWGYLGGSSDVRLAIEIVGLVTWWIAAFVLCFGLSAFRSFRFPLLFLFWMVPIPRFALDRVVAELQQGSAIASQFLFLMFSVPVSREGTILLIPGLNIEVAAECSSIRSSLMLLVTTMVLAHLLLRAPWRKVLVIALAVPLSVAKNGLRIFVIGMLGTRVNRGFLTGRLHHNGGIIFFLIALGVIFLLLWILRRGERVAPSIPQWSPARP
jgi:exosortase